MKHVLTRPAMLVVSVALVVCALWQLRPANAQEPPSPRVPTLVDGEAELRFAFDGTPWREVINWLAEESNLALHVQDLPTGSFTYADPDTFSTPQAIDRVNLFLLSQGFTLVRSGKLLSVINLGDPRSMQQLDALAKLITVDQLDQHSSHDVVKCIFPLGSIDAEDAAEELASLKLMTTPAIFTKTNRLMVTDTVSKLRSVKTILGAFEPSQLDNGTVMRNFELQHVEAEDILVVVRPHLGLATGEMIGIDVSISADLQGDNIFVTGVEDKVKLIEGLVTSLDKPKKGIGSGQGDAELKSHLVEGGNVETVYNVLVTLLAGKGESVRLSMDETSSSVVAFAPPDVQREIAQTVAEVQGANSDFEVIPLKTVDPYFAVSLLEEMLDLPDPLLDDPGEIAVDAPKIDADPGNMRLFVRAKRYQIDQIKKIVAGLDDSDAGDRSENIRLFPMRGKQAEQVLETAAKFWRGENPIILFPSVANATPMSTERVLNGMPDNPTAAAAARQPTIDSARVLTSNIRSQAPVIRCQFTIRGLLVQCDDTDALDQFEEHLRTIAGPVDSAPSPPIVFYLKYTKPEDAIRTLAEMMDGGEAAMEAESGSLVNGYVSGSSGSLLGSLVTSRTGTITLTAGTITVVADSRLNRLIAQGTTSDIDLVEGYLKVIDKDSSITAIETYGTSHVIELVNSRASEVAAVIREAYAGRITGGTASGAQPNQPGSPQQGQRDAAAAKATAPQGDVSEDRVSGKTTGAKQQTPARKSGNQAVRNLEPKMTVAVHEPSNSLIVTAPTQLFREVEQLAKLVDSRNEQTVRIVAPTNAAVVETLMQVIARESAPSGGRPASQQPAASLRSPVGPARQPQRRKDGR